MDCAGAMTMFSSLLDTNGTDEDLQAFWEHVRACSECSTGCLALFVADVAARLHRAPEPPVGLWAQIEAVLPPEGRTPGEVLTVDEAAAFLKVDTTAFTGMLPEIRHFQVQGQVRIRQEALDEWISRHEQVPAGGGRRHSGNMGKVTDLAVARLSRVGRC